jgi:hypothetical protein
MARAQGARSQLAAAFETTYGTAPASGYFQMPFASASLGAEQPLLTSELLGYPTNPIQQAIGAQRVNRAAPMIPLAVGVLTNPQTAKLAQAAMIDRQPRVFEGNQEFHGYWPTFPRGASSGEKYEIINSVLLDLARDLDIDLWALDALWWQSKLERQDNGQIKDAKFKAVWAMADQAEKTAKQSYGQTIERTVKNKDLRLSTGHL